MIPQEVQEVFVQRTFIVKQENIARRTYKIRDWLKLLSLLEEDKNYARIDQIIKDDIHEHFILLEAFWVSFIKRKFETPDFDRNSVQISMLALDDGPYFEAAQLIKDKIVAALSNKKLTATFCLGILQKMISILEYDGRIASRLFKGLRSIYEHLNNPNKVRQTFERELRKGYDDFDVTYDEYTYWQKDQIVKKKNQVLYQVAKSTWQYSAVQFDENLLSQANIKRSLFILENQNKNKIDEDQYIKWIEKLPTEKEKLWFLRRVALNYRQMMDYYLIKVQSYYSSDQEEVIKKFRVMIRLSENSIDIERRYLSFLVRRMSLHLTKEVDQQYYDSWGEKVTFFRRQINGLIQKDRKLMTQQIQHTISMDYYKLWIEVEEKIIKDKDGVSKLYELIIKTTNQLTLYEDYSASLINLQAIKQAKNVLKRYILHAQNDRSKQYYNKYLSLYGSIDDQILFLKEQTVEKQQKLKQLSKQVPSQKSKQVATAIIVQQNQTNSALSSLHPQKIGSEDNGVVKQDLKRSRDTFNDDLEQKIEDKMRKKLHMDGQYTVYVKGIPLHWKESDIIKILMLPTRVVRISLIVKNNEQRDYCYIEYDSKEAAEEEVRTNHSGYSFKISKPPSEYDQSKTIFVCALPSSATEQKIRNLFGEHDANIQQIRLKLQRDKNYAYVDFNTKQEKDKAFDQLHNKSLVIDGKKILIQHCDSNRMRNKKFIQVVFLKNISFKAQENDIIQFFQGKNITNISIPKSQSNQKKGFAYVQFEKFKDYQEALDMKKGQLFGRQFLIFKSDRAISKPRLIKNNESNQTNNVGGSPKKIQQKYHNNKSKNSNKDSKVAKEKQREVRDNSFFSNLFK